MRTYEQLTKEDQATARDKALVELLEAILSGQIRFNDEANGDNLQARIDKAADQAEQMQTPWFTHEYILDTCREDLEAIAGPQAEDALYPDKGEHVIYL
jgi:hypothetical protein